jgi:PAS domain S-box-containing protein
VRRRAEPTSQIANPLVQASLLGEAFEAADLAVLVSDEEGCWIAVNEQACTLLGYTREQLLGLSVADLVPDTDARACFKQTYAAGGQRGVVQAVRSDGSCVPVRYSSTPTRVAQMQLVLSIVRREEEAAA